MEDKKKRSAKVTAFIIVCIIAMIYNISPVDFIPDIIPVVGSVDDTLLILAPLIMGALGMKPK